ncbi:MAG: C39 family peptidase [Oscillospiraceae bacterium]|nr:C39 family peptidase [Oscillospiraceae bacterium]
MKIAKPLIILYAGKSIDVTYSVLPSNATDKTVVVSILWPEKATAELTPEGQVRISGLKSGSNLLYVQAIDSGFRAQSDIIVVDQVARYYMYVTDTTAMNTKLGNGSETKLYRSKQVTILGTVGNWYYVFSGGSYGFISKDAALTTSKYEGQILEFWQGNPANYAGIFDTNAYVNDRYGDGWTLNSKKIISGVPSFTMSSFEAGVGNCPVVSVVRLLAYYRSANGKSKIPSNNKDLYNDVRDIAIKYGYSTEDKDNNGHEDGSVGPTKINNVIIDALKKYGYSGKVTSNYLNSNGIYDFVSEIDAGRPVLLNITFGDYSDHTVTVIGYEIYTDNTGALKHSFLKVWDGWSSETRYIDYNLFSSGVLVGGTFYSWTTTIIN